MKILKYIIPLRDNFTLSLLKDSKILSFKMRDGMPTIWALSPHSSSQPYYEKNDLDIRYFILVGTGHDIDIPEKQLNFIGTIQDKEFVWHLFEDIT